MSTLHYLIVCSIIIIIARAKWYGVFIVHPYTVYQDTKHCELE